MYRPKKNDTILFGCSGFFGPIILENYPNIIAAGRTPPPKYIKNKYLRKRKIVRVFQKLILSIIAFNHELNKTESLRVNLKCIICKASSKKNL